MASDEGEEKDSKESNGCLWLRKKAATTTSNGVNDGLHGGSDKRHGSISGEGNNGRSSQGEGGQDGGRKEVMA